MLNKKIKQMGSSTMNIMGLLIVLVLISIYGFQIGVAYMDKYSLSSIVNSTFSEMRENATPREVKSMIVRKISVTTISIPDADVEVESVGNSILVNIPYEKNIRVTDKINLHIDLTVTKESK